MSETHLTEQNFSDLDLPPALQQGVRDAQFDKCTPIQAQALPLALSGKDIAGQAQTGTGKTATFLLATLNHLLKNPATPERRAIQPLAIILAPTRELAIQIHEDALVLSQHTKLKLCLAYGGTGYQQQRESIERGVDILIGTQGRLIDYFKQGVFDLKAIQVLVLDEADRMFDLGFIKDIRYILRRMPDATKRLNLLFSATLSHRVNELAYEHMNNPKIVVIETNKLTVNRVNEQVFYPANEEKIPLLLGLLRSLQVDRALVFVNTKTVAETILGWLIGNGFRAGVLSGDVPQNKRERLLQRFKDGVVDILVATDVAARGLHIPMVSHVFNYDLPQDAEDYVHRVGRTARAGASGDAVSFACERYAFSMADIEDYIGHQIPVSKISVDLLNKDPQPPKFQNSGGAGHRARSRSGNSGESNRPRQSSTKPFKRRSDRHLSDVSSSQPDSKSVRRLEIDTPKPLTIQEIAPQAREFKNTGSSSTDSRKPEVPAVG